MKVKTLFLLAAILGAAAVTIGAFGAHALPNYLKGLGLDEEIIAKREASMETGVRYHMYHALALFGIALFQSNHDSRAVRSAAIAILIGIVLFSGCIYAYVLTGSTTLVMVVPLGGVTLIIGWCVLALGVWQTE